MECFKSQIVSFATLKILVQACLYTFLIFIFESFKMKMRLSTNMLFFYTTTGCGVKEHTHEDQTQDRGYSVNVSSVIVQTLEVEPFSICETCHLQRKRKKRA